MGDPNRKSKPINEGGPYSSGIAKDREESRGLEVEAERDERTVAYV